jgi:hypothetical protein
MEVETKNGHDTRSWARGATGPRDPARRLARLRYLYYSASLWIPAPTIESPERRSSSSNPPSVVLDEVVARLMEQESKPTCCAIKRARGRHLKKYPDSLVFVNIDEGQSEAEWSTWIREVMADSVTATVASASITYNTDERLHRQIHSGISGSAAVSSN